MIKAASPDAPRSYREAQLLIDATMIGRGGTVAERRPIADTNSQALGPWRDALLVIDERMAHIGRLFADLRPHTWARSSDLSRHAWVSDADADRCLSFEPREDGDVDVILSSAAALI